MAIFLVLFFEVVTVTIFFKGGEPLRMPSYLRASLSIGIIWLSGSSCGCFEPRRAYIGLTAALVDGFAGSELPSRAKTVLDAPGT